MAPSVGVGLDFTLGLGFDDQVTLGREAAELGYEEVWTPEGSGLDSFQLCAMRWERRTFPRTGSRSTTNGKHVSAPTSPSWTASRARWTPAASACWR